jgi:uncharacterized protein YbjT (DUF2867 family)
MQPASRIAVAGATGRLGRHLVEVLEQSGHDVSKIARSTGVDVVTGEGLDAALAGADAIIDAATSPTPDQEAATAFFTASARNLQSAGARVGVRRIVVVGIIGADRFPSGYNAAKVAHERALLAGPIPVDILRAAQFHEFVEQLLAWGTQGTVAYMWEARTQLVAARTVAEAAAELATGAEAGPVLREIAGPREESMVTMAQLLAARRGGGLQVQGVSDPDNPEHQLFKSGALLPGPHATLAGPTFEEWLDGGNHRRAAGVEGV